MNKKKLFANKIILLNEVTSTNDWLKNAISETNSFNKQFVTATFQTKGKGQRNNFWESEKDKNLLLSTVVYPVFLSADEQFYLSMAVSLAISDVLAVHGLAPKIKWPNDIYIKNKKIAGILIENTLKGSNIGQCIIGLGVNLNQEIFMSNAPNPVSVKQLTGKNTNIANFTEQLSVKLNFWFGILENRQFNEIQEAYSNKMLNHLTLNKYSSLCNTFAGTIKGVNRIGQLLLQEENGQLHEFNFKEVTYLSYSI